MQQESSGRPRASRSSRAEVVATDAAAPDLAFARDLAADPRQIVMVADHRMRYLAVSDGACQLLGYTRAELLAMDVPEVVAESDADELYGKMIADGRQAGRITLVARDGREIKAHYEAAEVRSGGASYYASYLTPVDGLALLPGMQRNLRLVIADDEEPMRLLVRTLLSFVEHVEVVAEAVDGEEAVRLVQEHDPDLLLLDVRMPRLDGLAAAEMIRTLRPHTHIVLHSSDADAEMHRRANTLGLRLLDKMRVEQVVDTLLQPAAGEVRALPDTRIEAAILTALTGRATTPLIIVGADGSVPFYNSHAAELLDLPLPPRETDVETVRQRYQVLRPDDHTPVEPDQRPIDRSAREHEPVTETLIVARDGTETLCRFTSIPFHNDGSQFMGAALHVEPLADLSEVDGTQEGGAGRRSSRL